MELINKSVVIIRPKREFIKWANSYSHDGSKYDAEYFKNHSFIILIPGCDIDIMARRHVNALWDDIFKEALKWGNDHEATWPRNLTRKMFWQWFDMEFQSMVFDSVED